MYVSETADTGVMKGSIDIQRKTAFLKILFYKFFKNLEIQLNAVKTGSAILSN